MATRLTQLATESVVSPLNHTRLTQLATESVVSPLNHTRLTQLAIEVVTPTGANAEDPSLATPFPGLARPRGQSLPGARANAAKLQDTPISATTPADGDVLAFDSASGLWVPRVGGGGPAWVTQHPDTPPPSPNASNKEFAALTTHGGTVLGSPATAPSIVDHSLRVVSGTSGSSDGKGVEWADLPAGSFTMTAKLRRKLSAGNFWLWGLGLRANGSGAGGIAMLYGYQNGGFASGFVEYATYATGLTRSGFSGGVSVTQTGVFYPRVIYTASTGALTWQWSLTGEEDTFVTHTTTTATTALGAAPGRYLVLMDAFGSVANNGYCPWIRFT